MQAFRQLAEVFQKLERTSSSLTLVTLPTEFLSRLNPDEARALTYLLRGELAPPFASLEIGMAERMAVRAVADAYSVPQQRVERLLTTTGDLGTVAETLAGAKRGRAASILFIFDELRSIAGIAGKDSQARRSEAADALLLKRHLGEASELARMQALPFLTFELFQRLQANL
jgi:DNA ligase 1